MCHQRKPASQRHACQTYKATRKEEMKNEALLEEAELAAAFQGCEYFNKLTGKQIKDATIAQTIPKAVVDSGASSTCVKPKEEEMQTSECGGFEWQGPPCAKTGKKSNKIFSMTLGHTVRGGDVVELPLPLRTEAIKGHTVPGIKTIYTASTN